MLAVQVPHTHVVLKKNNRKKKNLNLDICNVDF